MSTTSPGLTPLKTRSTVDLIVLLFSGVVAFVIVAATVGIFVVKVVNPEVDIDSSVNAVRDLVSTLTGALVGLIAGKAQGVKQGYQEAVAEALVIQTAQGKEDG